MAVVLGTNAGFVATRPSADPSGGNTGDMDNNGSVIQHTAPVGALTVSEIGWWCDNATPQSTYEVGIYTDDGADSPVGENLIETAESATKALNATGWQRKVLTTPIAVTAGTKYWIGLQIDDTVPNTNNDYEATGTKQEFRTGIAALPDPWARTGTGTRLWAMYALYTVAVGGILTTMSKHW